MRGFIRTISDYFLGFSENNYEILNAVALGRLAAKQTYFLL